MKRFLLFLITGFAALLSAEQALSQVVFSNGIDVSGWFVISNGMVTLESTTNFQGDVDTRGLAPSLGQMYGVNPDTGSGIDNGDRLTLRPPILDMTNPTNRQFVIAASQILGSSTISVTYTGSNIVVSVAGNSLTVDQLDLTSTDARYVEVSGDSLSGDLDLDGHDLTYVAEMTFEDGSVALSAGTTNNCRFSGLNAGLSNTGVDAVGLGSDAASSNSGSDVNSLGDHAGAGNSGDNVNAMGAWAAYNNTGDGVNGFGDHAVSDNAGNAVTAFGTYAGRGNIAEHVNILGYMAGQYNQGTYFDALGFMAGHYNEGTFVSALGPRAAYLNEGHNVFASGLDSARENTGNSVIAIGNQNANGNTGSSLVSLGELAGYHNTGAYCTFIGLQAGTNNVSDNVIAIGERINGPNLIAKSCYLDGDLRLQDCNGKGGGTDIHFANGASIETTSTSFQFASAALIIQAQGDISMGSYTNGL